MCKSGAKEKAFSKHYSAKPKSKNRKRENNTMQTVYPGERKLINRLIRQMWKEMIVNFIKKIFGKKSEKDTNKASDDRN